MGDDKKVRTSPEVPEQLLNDFKTGVQAFNEGKLKGCLSPSIAEAMQLYLVTMYTREPSRLKHIENYIDIDETPYLDDPDAYQDRIIRYQEQLSGALQEVALQLQRDEPGGPTRFEQFLSLDAGQTQRREDEETDNPLQDPLLSQ